MKKIKRKFGILLTAACVFATPVRMPSAFAEPKAAIKSPPLERYTCYQIYAASLTHTNMGYFILQAEHKYAWGFGKGKPTKYGHYAFDDKGIHFTDGPLKGNVKGTFETTKKGWHRFELKFQGKKQYASDDGIITWYCDCDAHDPYNKNGRK